MNSRNIWRASCVTGDTVMTGRPRYDVPGDA